MAFLAFFYACYLELLGLQSRCSDLNLNFCANVVAVQHIGRHDEVIGLIHCICCSKFV